jgi:hypothetical protein
VRRRRLASGLAAVAVVVGAACASESDAAGDRDDEPTTSSSTTVVTSTAPSTIPGPDPDVVLTDELAGLAAELPPDSCLVVEGPELRFDHRGTVPLVPASTAKLLTATAALEALAPGGTGLATTTVDEVQRMLRDSDDELAARIEAELGGATATLASLQDGSVDLAAVELVDGTGHSRANRVTCDALVDLLRRPVTGALLEPGLAVAGRSGTLMARFRGTALEGVLRAKTGSLSDVEALAGVVDDGDPPLTFALVVNAPAPLPADLGDLEQRIGEALVAWTGEGASGG